MTTRTTAAATAAASPVCALRGEVHPVHAKYSTTHRARRCYFHTIERYAAFFAPECTVAMAGAVNAQKRF